MQAVKYKPFLGTAETAVRLLLKAQYFLPLYYSLQLYEDPDIPTLCTNGVGLWVNPGFWQQLSKAHRLTAVAHEIGHKMLLHTTRRGTRDPFIWNVAGDYVINLMLVEAGFEPIDCIIDRKPFKWLYDTKYEGMTTEAVYDALIKEMEDETDGQTGQEAQENEGETEEEGGEGRGDSEPDDEAGDDASSGKHGSTRSTGQCNARDRAAAKAEKVLGPMKDLVDLDKNPDGSQVENEDGQPIESPEDFEGRVRKEIREAEQTAKIAGDMPGWLKRAIGNANHAKVNWWEVLEQYLKGMYKADYSWRRFNKREFVKTGVLAPDMYDPAMGGVLILGDASGSISGREFAIYDGHTKDVLAQVKPAWVKMVWFDTNIKKEEQFERAEYDPDISIIDPVGGGGTDFRWFADYIEQLDEKPDVVLVLTDMYGPFGRESDVPLIWLSTSSIEEAPWGVVININ